MVSCWYYKNNTSKIIKGENHSLLRKYFITHYYSTAERSILSAFIITINNTNTIIIASDVGAYAFNIKGFVTFSYFMELAHSEIKI